MIEDLAVLALAAHRATRLVTRDTILDRPRDAIVRAAYETAGRGESMRRNLERPGLSAKLDAAVLARPGGWSNAAADDTFPPKLAELVVCRWCASVHLALLLVIAYKTRVGRLVAQILAVSSAATLLAGLER